MSNSVSTNSVAVVHDELVYLLLLFYKVSFVPGPLGKEGLGTRLLQRVTVNIYLEVRDSCVGSETHR